MIVNSIPSAIAFSEPGKTPGLYESQNIASVRWINTVVLPEQWANIKIIKMGSEPAKNSLAINNSQTQQLSANRDCVFMVQTMI